MVLRIFTVVVLLVFKSWNADGQESHEKNKNFQINGFIDGKSFAECGIKILTYDEFFKGRKDLDAREFLFDQTDGKNLSIPLTKEFTYIRINASGILDLSIQNPWLFVMPGDSLTLRISGNDIHISGRGAARVQCLWEIFKIDKDFYLKDASEQAIALKKRTSQMQIMVDTAKSTEAYYESLICGFNMFDYLYKRKKDKLDQYKQVISKAEYEFISFELNVWKNTTYLNYWFGYPVYSDFVRDAKSKIMEDIIKMLPINASETFMVNNSLTYADYIARKELLVLYFSGNGRPKTPLISTIFDTFRSKYSGNVYEKVMTSVIANSNQYDFKKALKADDLLSLTKDIGNPRYKEIIQNYWRNISGNLKIDTFNLRDTAGQYFQIGKLTGKVLVLDFWFTGCSNCIKLSAAMKPVIEAFKNDTNVVFVSINMDNSQEKWEGSLRSGIKGIIGTYSHPESVNLSSFPEGFGHPMIKALNITGAPHLVLVDKKGDILDRNPPRPNSANSQNAENLKQLIRKYLLEG